MYFNCSFHVQSIQSCKMLYYIAKLYCIAKYNVRCQMADNGKATLLFFARLECCVWYYWSLNTPPAHSFGLAGSALTWVQSYLTGRSQVVRIGSHSSNLSSCLAGVPQGSVLGPLLFSIYTCPITHIAQVHGIQQQQYADDTQLYVALSPNSLVTHVSALESCLESLQAWFCANSMTLNADKSNASFLPPVNESSRYLTKSL